MISRVTAGLAICSLLVSGIVANAEDEKLGLLLDRSPSPPNVVGYVNAESLNKVMGGSALGADMVQNVNDYWFISDLDIMNLRPKWEAGYATLKQPVDAETLAGKVDGYVDDIAGNKIVWAPSQTYFVPGKENRLGVLRPADRSLLSSWLLSSGNPTFSEFLRAQTKQPEGYLSLMLAFELENAFSPIPLGEKLKDFQSLKAQSPETVGRILASIKGVSIIVGRNGLNECIVKAEFAQSPASLKPIANELFAEMISRNGTAAPEVLTWSVDANETSLAMKGPITEETLSGVLGIFSLQGKAARAGLSFKDSDSANRTKEQQTGYRSKYYFDQVNTIVEQTRKHKSQTTGALAKWNDQRARQIDELPTLNVDPDMIQYGSNVAELLRGNALTVRQGNVEAGKAKATQGLNRGYNGYYGYGYDANSVAANQNVTSAYARGNAYANYQEILNQIDQMTADLRRGMTQKYQMQF
ncbi:hypothetical protein [Stieleria varia]|uniref:Uncharacterized protein n=1 Tax=Stieleria varia TaxID=2528005 RepID=A0A5C6B1S6_9BACT|nr:hypothetical protein [Stieleria varia]TWU04344.1 hypothetical protein Pla52n_23840 [Stieleria varia]